MKRIRTALCLILAAALLAGCAFLPSDSEPETPAPTDPLTGLALEWQGQRPVAVAIENSTAPPLSGAFPRRRWCWKPSPR